jgi:hypothetical protein
MSANLIKKIGKFVAREGVIITLLSALAASHIACPWQKKDHDDAVTTDSSGTPTQNSAPTLEYLVDAGFEDGVDPNCGKASTNFVFNAVYTDVDDNAPTIIKAVAKNQNDVETVITMTLGANPATSTYVTGKQFTTGNVNLPTGMYTIKFEASDGQASTSTGYANNLINLIILSDAGNDALELRLGQPAVFLTAAGTRTPYVAPKGESDELLKLIANSGDNDIHAKKFIKMLYESEAAAGYNILCGGTAVTETEFSQYLKFLFNKWTNGAAAAQTTDSAPSPVNGPVVDHEIDNKMSGSGQGVAVDFTNKMIRFYLKDKDGNEIAFPTYSLTAQNMGAVKEIMKKSVAGTYWINENTYNYNVYFGNGEQVPSSTFNE